MLSTSGHIASMVNPPGNPKATFQTGPGNPADPRDWLGAAADRAGQLVAGLLGLAGRAQRRPGDRPERLGGAGLEPMQPAPGSYVLDR